MTYEDGLLAASHDTKGVLHAMIWNQSRDRVPPITVAAVCLLLVVLACTAACAQQAPAGQGTDTVLGDLAVHVPDGYEVEYFSDDSQSGAVQSLMMTPVDRAQPVMVVSVTDSESPDASDWETDLVIDGTTEEDTTSVTIEGRQVEARVIRYVMDDADTAVVTFVSGGREYEVSVFFAGTETSADELDEVLGKVLR